MSLSDGAAFTLSTEENIRHSWVEASYSAGRHFESASHLLTHVDSASSLSSKPALKTGVRFDEVVHLGRITCNNND